MRGKRFLAMMMTAAVSISALGLGAFPAAAEEEAREVHIAIQPSAAFVPLYVVRESGWLEEALGELNVTVTWNDFESGPPMNESLSAGSSDIGVMGDVPTVSAIAAGQQTELVAIAADGPLSYAMLAAVDSEIDSPADLKGKIVGTTVGSTGHNLTDKLLSDAGLDINSDIQLVNISTGDAATVLSTGQVDAVSIWEPNVTRLVDDGVAKIIGDGTDCGLRGVNPIIARAEYAQNNQDVIKVLIEQYARGVASLTSLDPEVAEKVAADLSLDTEQLNKVMEKYDYNVVFADEDTESLQDTIAFLVKIGNLDEEYQIADYIKPEYVESADIAQYLGE